MEHIVQSQMMDHFDKYSILSDKQHGFRKKRSCETQLILTTTDLAHSLDTRSQTDMIITDFAKAFDKVPHDRLLLKLQNYGIRGKVLHWISNFLKNRKQRVVVGGEHSEWAEVVSGVPQGTVLGPLLFLVYINDLADNLNSNIRLFADDCVIYREINSDRDHTLLQEDINTLDTWQNTWQMKLHPDKCFVMRYTHKRKPKLYDYKLGSHVLAETNNHKYLGVTLNNQLSWSQHIQYSASKANKTLGFVRRNLYNCPKSVKTNAYTSLVRPHLEYSSAAWDPYHKEHIAKLESVQKRAARFVTNSYHSYDSVTKLVSDLGWDTLRNRRTANRLTILQKARHHKVALPVETHLKPVPRQSRHSNPNSYKALPFHKDCYKHSFFPQTVRDWNSLPYEVTEITDAPKFKEAVLQRLREH